MNDDDEQLQNCPKCPDGYIWTSDGPTGKCCPVCRGYAVVQLNGSPCAAALRDKPSGPLA